MAATTSGRRQHSYKSHVNWFAVVSRPAKTKLMTAKWSSSSVNTNSFDVSWWAMKRLRRSRFAFRSASFSDRRSATTPSENARTRAMASARRRSEPTPRKRFRRQSGSTKRSPDSCVAALNASPKSAATAAPSGPRSAPRSTPKPICPMLWSVYCAKSSWASTAPAESPASVTISRA